MRIFKILNILELNSPRITKALQFELFNQCRTIWLQSNNVPVIQRPEQFTVFGRKRSFYSSLSDHHKNKRFMFILRASYIKSVWKYHCSVLMQSIFANIIHLYAFSFPHLFSASIEILLLYHVYLYIPIIMSIRLSVTVPDQLVTFNGSFIVIQGSVGHGF